MLLLLMLAGPAQAESAGTLPKGSEVVYTGLGFTTFSQLDQGGGITERDRELRTRLDLYGSLGLTDALQLSLSAPVVYSTIADDPDNLPCPGLLPGEGYCESYATLGQARLDARYGLVNKQGKVTVGLAADVDRWNQGRRGQYNSAGSGRTAAEAFLVTGGEVPAGDWKLSGLLLGGYTHSFAPDATSADGTITVKAPGDTLRGSVELRAKTPTPVAIELGAHRLQRLNGVELDGAWVGDWFFSSRDRWNVLQYSHWAGSAKVSIDLPDNMGIHVGASRVLAVENGPADLMDVSVGWHRYFAP
jgi:hypothetical protein